MKRCTQLRDRVGAARLTELNGAGTSGGRGSMIGLNECERPRARGGWFSCVHLRHCGGLPATAVRQCPRATATASEKRLRTIKLMMAIRRTVRPLHPHPSSPLDDRAPPTPHYLLLVWTCGPGSRGARSTAALPGNQDLNWTELR
ncbi:hypothetical protein AAFF_G00108280 [Aldrovandia affinis]|uniref:Uncharacterized protein n=1 Tax=Aldrovandia affinis TaxID=143900 RepID=A0AAD7RTT3_9TELE|nr:hypothetical protein AAFF_G00108280 [Aldrovandia affinis]